MYSGSIQHSDDRPVHVLKVWPSADKFLDHLQQLSSDSRTPSISVGVCSAAAVSVSVWLFGLWLLMPCHSSGRRYMACIRKVPLASTVASSPGAAELHLKMIVKWYWRREHYHVVRRPSNFVTQFWDETQSHSANLTPTTSWSSCDLNVWDGGPSVLAVLITLLHKVFDNSRVLKGNHCIFWHRDDNSNKLDTTPSYSVGDDQTLPPTCVTDFS